MLERQTSGTLGDAFMLTCKISAFEEQVRVHHTIEGGRDHGYWHEAIRKIFLLARNVEEVIFEDELTDLPRIMTSASTGGDPVGTRMEFFPGFFAPGTIRDVQQRLLPCVGMQYSVVCPHGGKPVGRGRNTKLMDVDEATETARSEAEEIQHAVILGTDDRYGSIGGAAVTNLIGRTDVIDAMSLVAGAKRFVGTEGLLGFCALSCRVKSILHFTSQHAVKIRVVGTPWAQYCTLVGRRLSRWKLV